MRDFNLPGKKGFGKFGVAPKEARTFEDIVFDSKAELHRWLELNLLQKAGDVSELRRQVAFVLIPEFIHDGKKIRPTVYLADFVYRRKDGALVVEDIKGVKTAVYEIKKKLFLKEYGKKYVFFENRAKGF